MKINGNMDKFYHYAFPMQAALTTCNDEEGKTNVITLAWHTPISRNPPLYGISIAPKRYSHELIQKTKEFVVNFDETGRNVKDINKTLLNYNIFGGKDISKEFPELGNSALYCVTEIHTKEDIERLVNVLKEVLSK
jgi:flavin reductase (DIM6/NTAB) family NADH-FMN oxidoreductase RutF